MLKKLFATVAKIIEKKNLIFLQIKTVFNIVKEVEMLHPSGFCSKPINNDNCLVIELSKLKSVVLGFRDENSKEVKEGEVFLYSRDSAGVIQSKILLTQKGEFKAISLGNTDIDAKQINLNGSSKSFVTFDELDTALKSFMTMLNAHTHATPSGASATTLPPLKLDITAAKTTTVKTGG